MGIACDLSARSEAFERKGWPSISVEELSKPLETLNQPETIFFSEKSSPRPIKPNPEEQGTPDRSVRVNAIQSPHRIHDMLRGAKADNC